MRKISGLIGHNLKKEKGQYLSFGIIILITAFILNLAFVLFFQVDKAYDEKFRNLNAANINVCIPKIQNSDSLEEELLSIEGISSVETEEGIFTSAVIKEFRGVDFSMNTMFYNLDYVRKLNRFEMVEERTGDYASPIYVSLYVAQFGQFQLGDSITWQIGEQDYTFQIAGILEEMQYGNAGSGVIGVYLPEKTYEKFAEENKENKVVEYSFVTKEQASPQDISDEISSVLSEKNIYFPWILNSNSCKQVRTMVCSLTVSVLIAFAFIVLLVSMFLCKFRIQNTIEQDMANMGVLKAMGYTGNMILCAAIFPYMLVAVITALAGGVLSYAILPALAAVLALQSGFSFTLHFDAAALCVVIFVPAFLTLLFTYFAARRIKKLRPIHAIRGNRESRHGKRNYFPLDETAGSLQLNLIFKQIAASPGQNVLLFFVSFLIMVLLAFAGTLFYNVTIEPDNFSSTLAEETPGIILSVKEGSMEQLKSRLAHKSQIEKQLEYEMKSVKTGTSSLTAFLCEDFSLVTNDLCYEGRNPEKENEIAIGSALAEKYSIGDKIRLQDGEHTCTYDIVGFLQSVNYQGEVCELTQEGYGRLNNGYDSGSLYLYLKENVDVEQFLEDLEEEYATDIINTVNYDKLNRVSQNMYQGLVEGIIGVIFIVTVLIVLLILYMIIKSLIVRRKQEFGIYKAMGYSNIQLMLQIAGSLLPVSFLAVCSSAVAGLWYVPLLNRMVFGMIGAVKNNFHVSLLFLLLFAAMQILVNFLISVCLSLPIKKISAYSLIKE